MTLAIARVELTTFSSAEANQKAWWQSMAIYITPDSDCRLSRECAEHATFFHRVEIENLHHLIVSMIRAP
jgi:hypothetical protein